MQVGALKLRQLSHTNGNFWNAGAALAEESIRCQPGARSILLDILTEADIHRVVVLGYIAIDVVQTTIANLDIDFAAEYTSKELNEGGYHRSASATSDYLC